MFIFKKWNHILLPYKVYLKDDHIVIEAEGEYNEAYVIFKGIIKSTIMDLQRIYTKLNENIIKQIGLQIEYRDINVFNFDFSNVLTADEIKSIDILDKKAIVGGNA